MVEAHNGAVVTSQLSPARPAPPRSDSHVLWYVVFGIIAVAAITAIVVTAVMGLTTEALIIAIFTGAFFSRCAC